MDVSRSLAVLEQFGRPRLLVLGDLILDRYTWGDAARVSQEAPVILLRADTDEVRLGGAGAVCQMVRGLEADVDCAGVVGNDGDGRTVRRLLDEAGVDAGLLLVDDDRPTTVKHRFMGRAASRHPHQILRVDREVREPLSTSLDEQLIRRVIARLGQYQAVLVSDYDKGACTPRVLAAIIAAARAAGLPIVVDPIRSNLGSAAYARYRGATTMTPNRLEAELASGVTLRAVDDAVAAGRRLCADFELTAAVITLDREGMALVDPEGRMTHFPTRARSVYDITGAGDMVLSVIGVGLAAGQALEDVLPLANLAAGLEVERLGVAVVGRDEIRGELLARASGQAEKRVTVEQLAAAAQRLRAEGKRIVLTNGCFDLLHVGHVQCLEEAARLGDRLIVALNSDASVRRLKGPGRPVIGQTDRAAIVAALRCVDYVVVFDEDTPHELLRRVRPDVLVKGGTYTPDEIVGHEIVASYGGTVHVTGHVDGISTTGIVRSLARQGELQGPHFPLANRRRAASRTAVLADDELLSAD